MTELTATQKAVLDRVRRGLVWSDADGMSSVECERPGFTAAAELDAETLDTLDDLFNRGLVGLCESDSFYSEDYLYLRVVTSD